MSIVEYIPYVPCQPGLYYLVLPSMPTRTLLPGPVESGDQLDDDDAERECVGLVAHTPEQHIL